MPAARSREAATWEGSGTAAVFPTSGTNVTPSCPKKLPLYPLLPSIIPAYWFIPGHITSSTLSEAAPKSKCVTRCPSLLTVKELCEPTTRLTKFKVGSKGILPPKSEVTKRLVAAVPKLLSVTVPPIVSPVPNPISPGKEKLKMGCVKIFL